MRLRVYTFNKSIKLAVAFFVMAIFVSSCGEVSQPDRKTEVSKKTTAPIKQNGVMYVPSELAIVMREMYNNMKTAGAQLDSNGTIADSLLTGYEGMLTAEATSPDEIDDQFYGFANGWLKEVEVLRDNQTLENYNAVMNACVHCHESYCPGPIPKIKRLKIMP